MYYMVGVVVKFDFIGNFSQDQCYDFCDKITDEYLSSNNTDEVVDDIRYFGHVNLHESSTLLFCHLHICVRTEKPDLIEAENLAEKSIKNIIDKSIKHLDGVPPFKVSMEGACPSVPTPIDD